MKKGTKDTYDSEDLHTLHRVRITLTSRDLKAMERVKQELVDSARDKRLYIVGPVRLPVKTLRINTRKSPCGEGTNTFDIFELRLHKWCIDLHSPSNVIKQITSISLDPGVDVEVAVADG